MEAPLCQTGASPNSPRVYDNRTLSHAQAQAQEPSADSHPTQTHAHYEARKIARSLATLARVSADTYLIAEAIVKTYPVVNDKGQRQRLYRALKRTLIGLKSLRGRRATPVLVIRSPYVYTLSAKNIFTVFGL